MSTPDSERVKAWRAANRERYNAYQRDLMRKKRKEAKAAREKPVERPMEEAK